MMIWNLPAFAPAADVAVSESDVLLTFDVPGMTREDLTIDLVDGYLHLRGERRRPEPMQGARLTHHERPYGRFERRIALPDGIDPAAITASLDNGVLSLIVPKPERMKPRTIEIGGGTRQLENTGS